MAGAAAHHCLKKDTGQQKVGAPMAAKARVVALFAAAILCATAVWPVDDVAQLQERFDKETDGVHKAKLLRKLGDAQFVQERAASKANDFLTAGLVMEKYRDNVRAALDALKKTHPQAEKHPGGYKELEFHVGLGLREVRDVILAMPEPYRPPMQIVERDLLNMDVELLRLLFPRRPGEQPPLQQPASTPKKDEPPEKPS
jgi:hypothetical protein